VTIEELVVQIAEDKSRNRFQPRSPDAEKPRDVFRDAVAAVAQPLVGAGWRFAPSGPHATRRAGSVTVKLHFASSTLNVAEELVALHVGLLIRDSALGAWRLQAPQPRRRDDVVGTRHLGHLLDPPRWLDWNLADPRLRSVTLEDVTRTLEGTALPFIDRAIAALTAEPLDPAQLAGIVDEESLIEYYVRAGRADEMAPFVAALVGRYHDRARSHFGAQVARFRSEGLPEVQQHGEPNGLAYLVVQHDLPVDV
jgi:hypothetical protein